MLRVGDVVVLFDGTIRPPKHKWFLCVSVRHSWFLRISTEDRWRPSFPLRAADNPCIEHDSFLELRGRIEYDDYEIGESLRYPDNHKGRLPDATIRALLGRLPTVVTMTPEEIELISAELRAVLPE